LFITFEGVEGCGKSTQSKRLAKRLGQHGFDCLWTREPGGTRIGREIRKIILNPTNKKMSAVTELALYFSDRAQHLKEVIQPALDKKRIVVCDRFTDSTIVYQGYGRGIPLQHIRTMDRLMTGSFRPKLTILLDLDAEEGLRRAWRRNRSSAKHQSEARFDKETLAFHQRVRTGYLQLARRRRERYLVVPAKGTKNSVQEAIWSQITKSCLLQLK